MGLEGRVRTIENAPEIEPARVEMEPESPSIIGIFTAPEMGATMISHDSIEAIAGEGLKGDRYKKAGAYSDERISKITRSNKKPPRIPDDFRQLSIISMYGIQQANKELKDQGIAPFDPIETRRNIVVTMPPEELNSLEHQVFMLGEVLVEGMDLCAPCTRPAIVGKRNQDGKAFEKAFANKGGLRVRILNNGILHKGDPISLKSF